MTAPSRRRNRRDANATQPIKAVATPVKEKPPVTYSERAVQGWLASAVGLERHAADNAARAKDLADQAQANETAAGEHHQSAVNGEAEINQMRADAEAEAQRVLEEAEHRIKEVRKRVTERHDSASRTATAAAEQRAEILRLEQDGQDALRAAAFTRQEIARVQREHSDMVAAPEPNEAAVQRFVAATDAQNAVEGVNPAGETIVLPQGAGEQR